MATRSLPHTNQVPQKAARSTECWYRANSSEGSWWATTTSILIKTLHSSGEQNKGVQLWVSFTQALWLHTYQHHQLPKPLLGTQIPRRGKTAACHTVIHTGHCTYHHCQQQEILSQRKEKGQGWLTAHLVKCLTEQPGARLSWVRAPDVKSQAQDWCGFEPLVWKARRKTDVGSSPWCEKPGARLTSVRAPGVKSLAQDWRGFEPLVWKARCKTEMGSSPWCSKRRFSKSTSSVGSSVSTQRRCATGSINVFESMLKSRALAAIPLSGHRKMLHKPRLIDGQHCYWKMLHKPRLIDGQHCYWKMLHKPRLIDGQHCYWKMLHINQDWLMDSTAIEKCCINQDWLMDSTAIEKCCINQDWLMDSTAIEKCCI